ncbi:MAG: HAMP domain-containing protein, partial [Bradyrhizobium sp.]
TAHYHRRGQQFYERLAGDSQRYPDYFGGKVIGAAGGPLASAGYKQHLLSTNAPDGLLATLKEIKRVSQRILRINQENMEQANRNAKLTAQMSLFGYVVALLLTALLAVWFVRRLVRSIVRPISAVTNAAQAIGAGQLTRSVPVIGGDELAQLAHTFNVMTQHLRDFRASNMQRLVRSQQTSQATIDSFPDPILVIDLESSVELANPAARQVFGVSSESDTPMLWQPPDALRKPVIDALRGEKPYLTETFDEAVTFRFNGADHMFLPQVRPIRDPHGDILGAAVVLNDVTRFRLLDQIKSDLVATVSHELKTPLTSIRLALHLLLEETIGPLEPKQTELLL